MSYCEAGPAEASPANDPTVSVDGDAAHRHAQVADRTEHEALAMQAVDRPDGDVVVADRLVTQVDHDLAVAHSHVTLTHRRLDADQLGVARHEHGEVTDRATGVEERDADRLTHDGRRAGNATGAVGPVDAVSAIDTIHAVHAVLAIRTVGACRTLRA